MTVTTTLASSQFARPVQRVDWPVSHPSPGMWNLKPSDKKTEAPGLNIF